MQEKKKTYKKQTYKYYHSKVETVLIEIWIQVFKMSQCDRIVNRVR